MKTDDAKRGITDLTGTAFEAACDCGINPTKAEIIDECIQETEALFMSGSHHCAEAVVSVIRKHFSPETPEVVVRLVSGLGGGCCSGCICGALSAATIAFGMVLLDDKESVERIIQLLTLASFARIFDLFQALANQPPGGFDAAIQFDGIGFNQSGSV